MNIVAALLAALAIVCFLADFLDRRRPRRLLTPLGLALVTAAVMAQLIWTTPHNVGIH